MKYRNAIMFIIFVFLSFGCHADVNVSNCEINIQQNTKNILCDSGYFDFGYIPINFTRSIEFTIENSGTDGLELFGDPKVEISGDDAIDFTADTTDTMNIVQPDSSTTFTINFHPESLGKKLARISIPNTDRDENPYTFVIVGTCTANAPIINLKKDTENIPNVNWLYDFGEVLVNEYSQELVITIENIGSSTLHLTSPDLIEASGTDASMFSIDTSSTDKNIEKGGSTSFSISFKPSSIREKSVTISIASNDDNNNPYILTLVGKGVVSDIYARYENRFLNNNDTVYFTYCNVGGSSGNLKLEICNRGHGDLKLTGNPVISITGHDPSSFVVTQSVSESIIEYRESETVLICFVPSYYDGPYTATMTIKCNDPNDSNFTLQLNAGASLVKSGAPVGWIGDEKDGWQPILNPTNIDGSDYRSFDLPSSCTPDTEGNVYVSDVNNNRISKWDKYGNAIGWIGGGSNGWKKSVATSSGNDLISFDHPKGVVVDADGYIYVADSGNNRICKWDKDGNSIGWIGGGNDGWNASGISSVGADYKSFNEPIFVYLDASSNIYVADSGNNRICKWDKGGNAIGWIGGGSDGWKTSSGSSSNNDYQSFNHPSSVCMDVFGNFYIADNDNHRICKWNNSGNAVGWIGGGHFSWVTTDSVDCEGYEYSYFSHPASVFVAANNFIYIADTNNHRISKWTINGSPRGFICIGGSGWRTYAPAFNSSTSMYGFDSPTGCFVDADGYIYIADSNNHRISKWKD